MIMSETVCTPIEYVWIDGKGEIRSKTRIVTGIVNSINDISHWNYDGSSTYQASVDASEIILKPIRVFRCPFRRPHGLIVLCESLTTNLEPAIGNNRTHAKTVFEKFGAHRPWYGLEQEYFICSHDGVILTSEDHYCGVGTSHAIHRDLVEEHADACLWAGIQLSGVNAEVAPGQWEFQIGPVEGIDAADQLWIARYILARLSEKYNLIIDYRPKINNNINGSGCHTNFSTEKMREVNGMEYINLAIKNLEISHQLHIAVYGQDNEQRLTGKHETSDYHTFSSGIGTRNTSIRIPNDCAREKRGYIEDRRPASNCDPYLVTSIILKTVCENI